MMMSSPKDVLLDSTILYRLTTALVYTCVTSMHYHVAVEYEHGF